MSARVMIVDDEPDTCTLLDLTLQDRGYVTAIYNDASTALHAIESEDFDLILTDVRMPGLDGIELCRRVVSDRPGLPVVIVTALGTMETAIEAMRAGACDFLLKPFDTDELDSLVAHALETTHSTVQSLETRDPSTGESSEVFIGSSAAVRRLLDQVQRLASSDASVLLVGESGTGKELVARLLHRQSRRREAPFVPIHCGAVPEHLLESELFGHVKGAFTDAKEERLGLFLRAHGGTIFLDEIASMPLSLQPKLLRALETHTVRLVGGSEEVPFDARIVAAANEDLEQAVRQGTFRDDLLFRIDVLRIDLPPLRERANDVIELAERFTTEIATATGKPVRGLSREAAAQLCRYAWPGNVRELRNTIESAVALARGPHLALEDLPRTIRGSTGVREPKRESQGLRPPSLADVELDHIERVLEAVGGNKVEAAQVLGISRATLYRKLRLLGRGFAPRAGRRPGLGEA